nr:immunoglobulin light chain junction region [Macaca mulatta]MOX16825.1 immunoglobulin light chain junction region [Macaca mulatta]MOX16973.1 immunoglobulin light chain junction region [Macaca mulatta]MOX16987.1 immunoglobulin light chain junction region [Macaca mulatta]MOX17099.1 immunoglobulin light chain junction region [Macaca mulatta]
DYYCYSRHGNGNQSIF